jgi:IclR family transcriptional regulator, pca regulon regulatory protein
VFLSRRPEQEVEDILNAYDFTALTPWTIIDRAKIMDLINKAKEDGFTIAKEECNRSEITIAAPVVNNKNYSVASVNISMNVKNWDVARVRKELAPLIAKTAANISRSLGGKSTY